MIVVEPHQVAFSWNGLPQYAARLLRAAISQLGCGAYMPVIGTRPQVPIEGMEAALGQPVHWVEVDALQSWSGLGLPVPKLFFQSGWSYPTFNSLGAEVKAAGGKVIGLSDANWRGDFRQRVMGRLAFRLYKREHFDAMIVPGRSGTRLMNEFGFPDDRVFTGMYGADPEMFKGGLDLAHRPNVFLFVGQFIDRKDVLGLSQAFIRFHVDHPTWTLQLIGSGEQRDMIPQHPAIITEDFVQPEFLAERYRGARFFVLPSKVEAWGLVVHEAALCGCGLLLSDAIGSGDDLADERNSIRFAPGAAAEIEVALQRAALLSNKELGAMEARSRDLARRFGPAQFAQTCTRALASLGINIRTSKA